MIQNKNVRGTANLRMLKLAATKLGSLNDEVVYLGGCTTALFITDPLSLDVRPTLDVDCIIDITTQGKYYQFTKKLAKQGFKQSMEDSVLCRWRCDEIILDVMPTDEKILGFGNCWYKEAIQYATEHTIAKTLVIKAVTAPYLLATKIEAFKTRGNYDFYGSHDFEDIITVIAGNLSIVENILSASKELQIYLKDFFKLIIDNDNFQQALPGHVSDGPVTEQRVIMVMNRIKEIIDLTKS